MRDQELRRYTDVLSVLDILRHKRLTLMTPHGWADENDLFLIEVFRERVGAEKVLALSLAETGETFHHWRIFSGGEHGACVIFRKEPLLEHLAGTKGLKSGPVEYWSLEQLRNSGAIDTDRLPFIKRSPFRDERGFRLIRREPDPTADAFHVPIPLSVIRRVIFSPFAPAPLVATLVETIRSFDGCEGVELRQSRLTNSAAWRKAAEAAAKRARP